MGKHDAVRKSGMGRRKRLAHIAEQEEPGWRYAIRMGGNGALADIDFTIREQFPKMVIRSAVTEPELKHVTIQTGNHVDCHFEASALRLEPADEAVQPAHRCYAAMPAVSRSCFTSARAALS